MFRLLYWRKGVDLSLGTQASFCSGQAAGGAINQMSLSLKNPKAVVLYDSASVHSLWLLFVDVDAASWRKSDACGENAIRPKFFASNSSIPNEIPRPHAGAVVLQFLAFSIPSRLHPCKDHPLWTRILVERETSVEFGGSIVPFQPAVAS